MEYGELVNIVKKYKLRTQMDVISFLIGYNKVMTESDWYNIMRLYRDGFVKK